MDREPVAQVLLVGQRRGEPHREVHDLEELRRRLLLVGCQRRNEVDRRCGRGRRLVQKHRQRRDLVAGLDLLDAVEFGRAEQLRAVQHEGQVGVGANDLVDALGLVALPVRPGQQVLAAAVAGGATADIGEVVGVAVDELQRVVPVLLDRRDGEHQRFGTQVRARPPSRGCPSSASGSLCPPACTRVRCCGSRSSRPCTRGPRCRRSTRTAPGSCRPSGSRRYRPLSRSRGPVPASRQPDSVVPTDFVRLARFLAAAAGQHHEYCDEGSDTADQRLPALGCVRSSTGQVPPLRRPSGPSASGRPFTNVPFADRVVSERTKPSEHANPARGS